MSELAAIRRIIAFYFIILYMDKNKDAHSAAESIASKYILDRGVDLFPTLGGLFLVLVRKGGVCQHWADFLSITIKLAH